MAENLPIKYRMEWPVIPFDAFEDSGYETISMEGGDNPIQLSKNNCISFNNGNPNQQIKGKVTSFGHGDRRLNRIFYKPWVQDPANGNWKWGEQAEIALVEDHIWNSTGKWNTIQIIPCPNAVAAMGGGKRKQHRRKSLRKTRHTRRRRMSRRKN